MLNDKRLQNYPHRDTYTHRHVFSSQKTWNTHFPTKLPLRLMVLLTNCFLLTAFYLSCF